MIAEQLKKSILQAAIQGKLTEKLPEDGDARDLLKEIQKEKDQQIKEGKIKKEKPLPEISEDEIPFDIPDNWCWVRLGEVTDYGVGKQEHQSRIPSGAWILELEDIEKETFKLISKRYDRIPGSSKNKFKKSDVLYGKLRPYLKKVIIADVDGYCSTEIIPFRGYCNVDSSYLKYWMVAPSVDGYVNQITHGMDMPRLGTDKAKALVVPLPPLAEQHRIVERLNVLLPEIEKLEEEESKLEALQKSFPKKMKDSILQYAIQGKLTEQLESDGDAHDFLIEIQKEKERLVKEGKIKKGKPLPEITEDEIPFDIPENWCWVRLGDIGIWAAGATPNRSRIQYYQNGTIPWLKTGDLNDNLIQEIPEYITELALKDTSVKLQPKGTVLVAMYGATIGKIGLLNIEATTNQACCGCNTYNGVYNWYLFYFLMSHKQEFINQGAGGAQPNISREKIVINLMPLPPLAEQLRIVDRLNQLLPLCDNLE